MEEKETQRNVGVANARGGGSTLKVGRVWWPAPVTPAQERGSQEVILSQPVCVSRGGQCPGSLCPSPALQSPQPAVPEGCLGVKRGAHVTYLVNVNMLSCACQHQPSKTVSLGKTLSLSGAAYELAVVTKTRFGRSSNQKRHIPAQDLAGAQGPEAGTRGRWVPSCAPRMCGPWFIFHAQKNEIKMLSK